MASSFWLALCVGLGAALVPPTARTGTPRLAPVRAAADDVAALAKRVDALEAEVAALRAWRRDALASVGAVVADLRAAADAAPAAPATAAAAGGFGRAQSVGRSAGLADSMAARAALGAVQGRAPAAGAGKNDAFLDDDLEELLEIGGDPSFLEEARDAARPAAADEWDGVIDETAYFDDD